MLPQTNTLLGLCVCLSDLMLFEQEYVAGAQLPPAVPRQLLVTPNVETVFATLDELEGFVEYPWGVADADLPEWMRVFFNITPTVP